MKLLTLLVAVVATLALPSSAAARDYIEIENTVGGAAESWSFPISDFELVRSELTYFWARGDQQTVQMHGCCSLADADALLTQWAKEVNAEAAERFRRGGLGFISIRLVSPVTRAPSARVVVRTGNWRDGRIYEDPQPRAYSLKDGEWEDVPSDVGKAYRVRYVKR